MAPTRVHRTALSERACLQCQKRKTRCVPHGDVDQPCQYCERTQRECIFSQPPSRTPLTRKNLQDAEAHCRELESLLEQSQRSNAEGHSQAPSNKATPDIRSQNPVQSNLNFANDSHHSPYEWDETQTGDGPAADMDQPGDGMASFGGGNIGIGYLGTTSGHALLDTISSALSPGASTDFHTQQNKSDQMPIHRALVHPLSQTLATSHVQEQLVTVYFESYNKSYPVLHEGTFRGQCILRNKHFRDSSWYMIYHMVLAIGEWIGGFTTEQHSLYYDAARSRFGPESLERGNLATVQAFLLMSNYLQKRGRPNTAFNLMGIAHRMAFGLGLHRELNHPGDTDTLSQLSRRTLFWVLYCFDSGFSITTGRPTFMLDSFIDVNIPRNVDDSGCRAQHDQPSEVPYPTNLSALIAQARLAKLANKAYAQFSGISPSSDAYHQTSVMEHMLQTWRSSLPGYFFSHDVPTWFKRSRKIVLWKEENIRILLLLGSQRQRTDLHEKIAVGERYRSVATDTLMDICTFFEDTQMHFNPGFGWYATYFILQAALALSVHELAKCSISSLPQSQQREDTRTYDQLMDQSRACLQSLSRFDPNAVVALRGLVQSQKGVVRSRTDSIPPREEMLNNESLSQRQTETSNHSQRQSSEMHLPRDTQPIPSSARVTDPLDAFPYESEATFTNGLTEFMDTSLSAFDNGDFLNGVFQDCYGPFQL